VYGRVQAAGAPVTLFVLSSMWVPIWLLCSYVAGFNVTLPEMAGCSRAIVVPAGAHEGRRVSTELKLLEGHVAYSDFMAAGSAWAKKHGDCPPHVKSKLVAHRSSVHPLPLQCY
jgi:hypothetical protein